YSAVQVSTPFAGTATPAAVSVIVVSTVTLTLQDLTVGTSYYNGSAWQNGLITLPAQGPSGGWSFNSSGLSFVNDHQYTLSATAYDNAGNFTPTSTTFVYDVQKPTTAVTSPSAGYLTSWSSISGTASDRVGAPAHPSLLSTGAVSIAVQQVGLGWWNGTDFTGGNPNYNVFTVVNTTTTGGSPNTWSTTLPGSFTSVLQSGATYFIVSRSVDNAANAEFGTTAGAIPA